MNRNNPWWIALVLLIVFACCCFSLAVAGTGLYLITNSGSTAKTPPTPATRIEPSPQVFRFTEIPPGVDLGPAYETLWQLQTVTVPNRDLNDLARRLQGKKFIPTSVPAKAYRLGDRERFWVSNVDTNENFGIQASLRYSAWCAYLWIEDGIEYRENDLRDLAETFCDEIYPTTREFFGSEWSPGIDEDPHLYILYTSGLGASIAAYFSSADSIHPLAQEYSNAHEMFVINADNTPLDDPYTYGVLAHEFQHMIHWYRDRNEESWLNEGFSELAAFLNGYNPGGFDYIFAQDPDLQLNDWPNDPDATTPHYGAGFLFVAYFLDRFGEEATKALVAHPDNGMDSIDAVLAEIGARDSATGQLLSADDVFVDWTLANYLQDSNLASGRYSYWRYPLVPRFYPTETLDTCDSISLSGEVHQYATDYIEVNCSGRFIIQFEGNQEVGVLPVDTHSGQYAFWSNKGDESDMTLTQTFDFTEVNGPITLTYYVWYDLEKDYDYLYLLASENGEDWDILITPSCTTEDPSGNSYGCGYNGTSGAYIREQVDLSRYAGKKVTLRFEYVTDAAINGEGLLLDDIAIPELGYFTDFEHDDGGWQANGFVRIQNRLPQTFRLTAIQQEKTTRIQTIPLDETQQATFAVNLNPGERLTLVISGTTRFTRQPASYRLNIQPR